mmetsp:Transcript_154857/g.288746  ORF Transcript_154857/g.288746 Transcript_154857/m.288746 type:complete len:733 (-) Transcript_154857:167-2365(-)
MEGSGFLQLDEMSDDGGGSREPSAPKVLNSNVPKRSDSTGDSNIERVLKEQVLELRSVLTDQHTRALHAVEEHMDSVRQLKVDLSDLRVENQRLRQQLHAAGLSSSIPPWHGMGGTGESSSSESKPRPYGTSAQEERPAHSRPAPPGQVNHAITSPDTETLVALPGSTNAEIERNQMWQNATPKLPPLHGSWAEKQDSGRHNVPSSAIEQSSAATFDTVEDLKEDDFKSVLPQSQALSDDKSADASGEQLALVDAVDTRQGDQDDDSYHDEEQSSHGDGLAKRPELKRMSVAPKTVFADAAAMKEKLRAALHAPEYNVANFYHDTGIFQKIARSTLFDNFTLCVIFLNAIWIWIDTDYNDAEVLLEADIGFFLGENLFCVYFAFEWIVRFMAFKNKRNGLKDSWFVFDSCLVLMMVLETWVVTIVIAATASNVSGGLGDASILRLLRLLRLTRMARMARLLRALPELMILIKGMAVATRSVFFTLVLLIIIIYLFAIAFTTLAKGTDIGDQYFDKVPHSMGTLLLGGILPDHSDIVNEIGAEHFLFAAVFLFFMLLGSLTVMNMLVGVIVQVVSIVSAVEKEQMVVNFVKIQLRQILKSSGILAGSENNITKAEFESLLQKPEAARALHELGVDVVGLVDFTDFIFKDDVQISFPTFMEMVLQLRGTNTATVKDIVDFRKFILSEMSRLEDKITGKILPSVNKLANTAYASQPRKDKTTKVTRYEKVTQYEK